MGQNMMVDGSWEFDADAMTNEDGEFVRSTTSFRDTIDAAEPGRYHLYISRACPWAHGAVLVRALAGLEDAITMDIVDPWRGDEGWRFSPEKDGCTEDTVNEADFLHEVYTAADPEYTGRITVPVLWDKEEDTIVNNESIEIMRQLATTFDTDRELYPTGMRDEIDRVVERLYEHVNNGVYKAGFASSQEAYDEAVTKLFEELDHWDDVLSSQRYLVGDTLTLADLRLFATLVRFDEVYHNHFKCNKQLIMDYENLWPYLRDIYQTGEVARTVNMSHIKEHYYTTHSSVNPKGLVPIGPSPDYDAPHDRVEVG